MKKLVCILALFSGLLMITTFVSTTQKPIEEDEVQQIYKKSDDEVRRGTKDEGIVFF